MLSLLPQQGDHNTNDVPLGRAGSRPPRGWLGWRGLAADSVEVLGDQVTGSR